MTQIACLFPGQGSQSVGMGKDLFEEFAYVRELFEMASDICRLDLTRLCFEGPMEELTQTVNLQPAITVVNLALLAAIQRVGVSPAAAAGHSLGEYGALAAAGVVSLPDAVRLVYKRGELMHRESLINKGAMTAVMGLTLPQLTPLVREVQEAGGKVSVANHNMETQIVITGAPEAVARAADLAAAEGAKTVPLKVSGAWHSELIRGAEAPFRAFVETVSFSAPAFPVLHNVTADTENDPEAIRGLMVRQICSPVRWHDTMHRLITEGTEIFAEIGPGKVLTGILKKTLPRDTTAKIYTVNDLKSLEKFLKEST